MSEIGRFGVFLPSYIWAADGPERSRGLRTFARTVEDLGFDSLFITDHLFAAKRFYSVSFLEPLLALAVAAGVTERVRLGTSILIMPLRNPVILATEHRLRPILLTAAAAILGMIPIAPTVFWGPMAYAVMGGLIVATLLTLVFLPALYVAWFRIQPAETTNASTGESLDGWSDDVPAAQAAE